MAMTEHLEVVFPGGQRVDARLRDLTIATDQLIAHGGAGAAPQPFDLFLASIATCAGIFALKFCQSRELPTAGMRLTMDWQGHKTDPAAVSLRLTLPDGFPDKYRDGILRAMDLCAVKHAIEQQPRFRTELAAD